MGTQVEEVHAERMRRLERANEVRSEKKRIKHDALIGKLDAASLLLDPPKVIEREPVWKVLTWFHGIGPRKAKATIRRAAGTMSDTLPVGSLSRETRQKIVTALPTRYRLRHR
jgi:hypothetical protein